MAAPAYFHPNTIYCGDCLDVLNSFQPSSVDLIYVDPPFGSGEDYEVVFRDGVEVRHFKDRWVGGKPGYVNWMKPRACHITRYGPTSVCSEECPSTPQSRSI